MLSSLSPFDYSPTAAYRSLASLGQGGGAVAAQAQGDGAKAAATAALDSAATPVSSQTTSLLTDPTGAGGGSAWVQAATAEFAETLGNYFRSSGLSDVGEPMLAVTSSGEVRVINAHPSAQAIQALFQAHPELKQQLEAIGVAAGQSANLVRSGFVSYGEANARGTASAPAGAYQQASQGGGESVNFCLVLTPTGPEMLFPGSVRAMA
ncbi:hypothetical protein [Azospira inquinata]|uniref:Uncharacterized protein n=1 Tax=Azospira inquinata TaxID=2785627 RepID=A0A975SLI0_9RHOO|nr:hypothetical protein [Azospira inquinata]QWT46149.1 hypothetical protein J8L76_00095 [Azospira inquinata]QWT48522.1 hypothetical protein Azoinq_11770 [Azospira inquinata]